MVSLDEGEYEVGAARARVGCVCLTAFQCDTKNVVRSESSAQREIISLTKRINLKKAAYFAF